MPENAYDVNWHDARSIEIADELARKHKLGTATIHQGAYDTLEWDRPTKPIVKLILRDSHINRLEMWIEPAPCYTDMILTLLKTGHVTFLREQRYVAVQGDNYTEMLASIQKCLGKAILDCGIENSRPPLVERNFDKCPGAPVIKKHYQMPIQRRGLKRGLEV